MMLPNIANIYVCIVCYKTLIIKSLGVTKKVFNIQLPEIKKIVDIYRESYGNSKHVFHFPNKSLF